MYKLMFLFFRVKMAVCFISVNFSFSDTACGRADGGFGRVVKIMIKYN